MYNNMFYRYVRLQCANALIVGRPIRTKRFKIMSELGDIVLAVIAARSESSAVKRYRSNHWVNFEVYAIKF